MRARGVGAVVAGAAIGVVVMIGGLSPAVAGGTPTWSQFGGGPAHTGSVVDPSGPDASNVAQLTNTFVAPLPGVVDGEVVYEPGVATPGGTLDLVFSLSKDGWISAEDAHTGAVIWKHQYGPGSCRINNGSDPCYTTSSPALDPSGAYVYAYGLDGRVHKYAAGTGVETKTGGWPELTTTKPYDEKGSSALTVVQAGGHSYLYATNGGYPGDRGDYQGHVTTIDLATGAQKVFNTLCSNRTIHFTATAATDCSNVQSAVWAREGVDYDAATGKVYLATGNSVYDGSHNWGDSVLAINPDGSGTSEGPIDSYTPTNQSQLNASDQDLGSAAPTILAPVPGSSIPNLGVQGGKDQKLRLLNLSDLSGHGGPGHTGGELQLMNVPQGGLVFAHPAAWSAPDGGSWLFVSTGNGISGIQITAPGGTPQMTTKWTVSTGGTSPIVVNGVLYYLTGSGARALDPTTGHQLWADTSGAVGLHWQSVSFGGGMLFYPDGSHLRGFHLGGAVTRIDGADRYDTGALVSGTFDPGVGTAYVASGADFPDALSGSAAAGRAGGPVLLVQRDAIPTTVRNELGRLKPHNIVVLGGVNAVSGSVLDALKPYAIGGTTTRIAGVDRYDTSAQIAASFPANPAQVYVVSGESFPDALSASAAAAGSHGGPLLLVQHDAIPASIAAQLTRLHPTSIHLIGGANAVDADVAHALTQYGTVDRIAGADRFATSAQVAAAIPHGDGVYLATGMDYPDGLTGGAAAGRDDAVLLLVEPGAIPAPVSSFLTSDSVSTFVIVGGPQSVSNAVESQLVGYLH